MHIYKIIVNGMYLFPYPKHTFLRQKKVEPYLILARINLGRDSLLIDLLAAAGYVLIGLIFHAVCRTGHRRQRLAAPADKPVKIDRLIGCYAMLTVLLEA